MEGKREACRRDAEGGEMTARTSLDARYTDREKACERAVRAALLRAVNAIRGASK